MRGVVKYALGRGNMEVRDMPEPDLKPGHVKIEVEAAGICGTDLHIYLSEYPSNPPVIVGHEVSGTVVDLDGADDIAIGDAVTAIPTTVVCGECRYCQAGDLSLCAHRLSIGSGVHGTFTQFVVVPAWAVRKIPANIDIRSGALSEPLCCCVKAVSMRTQIMAGDIAVVTGPGPIGLMTAQVARAEGAHVILTGTSIDEERLALGARWADHVVNVETEDLAGIVGDLTDGYGADVILECSGSAAGTRSAIDLVRKQGTIMQIGLHGVPVEVDFFQAELKEITIKTSFAGSLPAWDRTMLMMEQGKIDLKSLISDVVPLTDFENAFERLLRKEGMKMVLQPVG
ncbi:MAG: zinc-binding dehydrogenase [Gemmatimonadota bacterium]|nr:zinc-binding dehydrogenase [Gemmatimonadota bacterium]